MSKKRKTVGTETAAHEGSMQALTEASEGPKTVATIDSIPGMFVDHTFAIPEGVEVKSLSPLIAPAMFPANRKMVGKFNKIFETEPTKGKKGVGIEIIPLGMQSGIALPAVTVIARALELDVDKGKEATSPFLGRYIMIEKLPNRIPSKQGQDAWNFLIGILPADYKPVTLPVNSTALPPTASA